MNTLPDSIAEYIIEFIQWQPIYANKYWYKKYKHWTSTNVLSTYNEKMLGYIEYIKPYELELFKSRHLRSINYKQLERLTILNCMDDFHLFEKFTNLKVLKLHKVKISNALVRVLGQLKTLEHLVMLECINEIPLYSNILLPNLKVFVLQICMARLDALPINDERLISSINDLIKSQKQFGTYCLLGFNKGAAYTYIDIVTAIVA